MSSRSRSGLALDLGGWFQQSLFTRSAESYFNPLIQSFAPAWAFSRRYRQARVVRMNRHHENAITLTLRPPAAWQGFIPGQYVCCEFEINGVRRKRNYSISSSCSFFEKTGQIQVTVHRVEGGLVSNYILDDMRLDSMFLISDAMGEFGASLNDHDRKSSPVLLLAAGSGITPMASMIGSGQLEGRKTLLLYSCGKAKEHLFGKSFEALALGSDTFNVKLHCTRERASDQRINQDMIEHACRDNGIPLDKCEVFVCGGSDFTESMIHALQSLRLEKEAIHFESFDSQLKPFQSLEEARVQFSASGKNISSKDGRSLLEQAESLGLDPQYGCRMGICHSCTCKKNSGVVRNMLTGELSSADEEEIRLCVSQALGQVDIHL